MRIRTEWQARLSKFATDKIQVPELNTQSCITYNNGQMEQSLDKTGTCVPWRASQTTAWTMLPTFWGGDVLVYYIMPSHLVINKKNGRELTTR
jgi:hypothetical protein